MATKVHANATTTPEMREFIRQSDLSVAALARLFNVSEATVRKWRQRDSIEDGSHAPRTLHTTLTPVQEYVVVELRKSLLLSLDELLALTREFVNPQVSRAGLARCLKRHGVSRLDGIRDGDCPEDDGEVEPVRLNIEHLPSHQALRPAVTAQSLADVLAEPVSDVVQVASRKLPVLGDDQRERRLFIASDPQSRWVYVDIYEDDAVDAASRYMSHALRHAPFHIRRILAGNYNEFMRRYRLIEENQPSSADSDHE